MGLSTNTTTFEPIIATGASEESPQTMAKGEENNTLPASSAPAETVPNATPTAAPTHEQKNFRDILSYEDKWIGWDGPVWCNRYGRFENKTQAAEDDGYKSDGSVVHQSTLCSPFQNRLDFIAV